MKCCSLRQGVGSLLSDPQEHFQQQGQMYAEKEMFPVPRVLSEKRFSCFCNTLQGICLIKYAASHLELSCSILIVFSRLNGDRK